MQIALESHVGESCNSEHTEQLTPENCYVYYSLSNGETSMDFKQERYICHDKKEIYYKGGYLGSYCSNPVNKCLRTI